MLANLDRRHLTLISAYSTRQALRSGGGLAFLLLALFFGLCVTQVVLSAVEQIIAVQQQRGAVGDPAQMVQQVIDVGRPVIEWALSDGASAAARRAWLDHLLQDRPALLSVVLVILIFGMPLVIPVGAFNQTAGEIGNRGIRYLLLRTARGNLFLGRFLATALLVLAAHAFTILTVILYLGLSLRLYGAWALISWGLVGLLALAIQSLPYIALCAWISARNDTALPSLVTCVAVIGGVLLVSFLAGLAWAPAGYLEWLLPWGIQNQLLAPHWYQSALAAGACLLYTAVYLFLGHRQFCRRDL